MVRTIVFIGISILYLHCSRESQTPGIVSTPATQGLAYLALGDSYTIGQSVSETDRFPAQSRAWLNDHGVNLKEPEIIATTGWTTLDLQNAINARGLTKTYDLVTLLIGVNDQYRWHDTSGYRDRFHQLLTKAVSFAGGRHRRVFILSIPDYSVTPFGMGMDTANIRNQIDEFNMINKQVTAQMGCTYLDITPATREMLNDPSLIAGDGLHPSGKEYKLWSDRLAPMMKNALE